MPPRTPRGIVATRLRTRRANACKALNVSARSGRRCRISSSKHHESVDLLQRSVTYVASLPTFARRDGFRDRRHVDPG
jgi:hypothetical protein